MQDVLTRLTALRRPALLMRAARFGAAEYRRERTLRRHFVFGPLPGPTEALVRLLEIEGWQEDCRRTGDAAYSIQRHVDTMIAVLGEARLAAEARGPQPAPAPTLK
ncbi:DUF6477 family protein [Pseudooceanicola sp.]|jgi:hypothetical protein|uniref:DUF6477 family protein n=1 Tax=Pseudooceanicola sp. TaxID=1914328 RepID=UPI004059A1EC